MSGNPDACCPGTGHTLCRILALPLAWNWHLYRAMHKSRLLLMSRIAPIPDVVVFNILIPCTDATTGIVHLPSRFDAWVLDTAARFGGVTVMGLALQGLWFDPALPRTAGPMADHNNWYKVGVEPERIHELRLHVRETARSFGQKCLYLERAGEAEFIYAYQRDSPDIC